MLKQISHMYHLARAGLTIARYDVIGVDQLENAPVAAQFAYRLAKKIAGTPAAAHGDGLNAALVELGPSYIKLGQFLATRADFVGKERALELSELQDRLKPFEQNVAEREVVAQLGKPLDKVFSSFSQPIAAASIAQVHKAQASDSKKQLAIKILRPNVKRRFKADLDRFGFAARMLERFSEPMRRLRPVDAVKVLAKTVDLEMDLRMEAAAMVEMAENIKGDPGFRVPKIDWTRTTGRILASEWIDGIPLNEVEKLRKAGIDLKKLAVSVIQSFLRHAIRDGFFHADMHQGNLFVDGKGDLVAVDFGIMGRLDIVDRLVLAQVLYGFTRKDYLGVAQVHFDAGYVPQSEDVHMFAQSLRAIGEPIMDKKAEEISMGHLLGQLLEGTERFNMKTQPQLLLLQKTMIVVEGVARTLDPQFNMWIASEPVVREWIEKRLGPVGKIEDVGKGAGELARMAASLPEALGEVRSAAQSISAMNERDGKGTGGSGLGQSGRTALWVGAISLAVLALAQIF